MSHVVQWVTASPLWDEAVDESKHATATLREQKMRQPALLRFEQDAFMEELGHLLETAPETLKQKRAEPVTYRVPTPGDAAPTLERLKLYQAVHGHFYLVAATLACRLPGLPEHEVATTLKESVSFVLRRLADGREWAWKAPADPTKRPAWDELAPADVETVAADEQLLPLFPMGFTTAGRKRRLFVGLVPTSSGEAFKAAGKLSPLPESGAGDPGTDPRHEELQRIFVRPMAGLKDTKAGASQLAEQRRDASRFILLDLAEFLRANVKPVWAAIHDDAAVSRDAETKLVDALTGSHPDTAQPTVTWRSALKTAWDKRKELMGDVAQPATPSLTIDLHNAEANFSALEGRIKDALPPLASLPTKPPVAGVTAAGAGGATADPTVPKLQPQNPDFSEVRYVVRCVYLRPQCEPLDHAKLVSEPSREFTIAPFFDPDAPARPIQITMPLDTSIAGLRKHRKSVNVLMAKQLREQMTRVSDLKKAMDGDFADAQSFDLGVMCSFSIPIITLCALILMMIVINLLNIVFWWAPFLKICLPIGLEAKKA